MITTYIVGAAVGLAFGLVIGLLKYICLWKKIIKDGKELTMGALYIRMGISYAVNIATLLLVFLLRDSLPFNFAAALIGAAVGLSVSGKLAPVRNIVNYVKTEPDKVKTEENEND